MEGILRSLLPSQLEYCFSHGYKKQKKQKQLILSRSLLHYFSEKLNKTDGQTAKQTVFLPMDFLSVKVDRDDRMIII